MQAEISNEKEGTLSTAQNHHPFRRLVEKKNPLLYTYGPILKRQVSEVISRFRFISTTTDVILIDRNLMLCRRCQLCE